MAGLLSGYSFVQCMHAGLIAAQHSLKDVNPVGRTLTAVWWREGREREERERERREKQKQKGKKGPDQSSSFLSLSLSLSLSQAHIQPAELARVFGLAS